MDFAFTEDQDALRQLAHKIFADHCTHERLRAVEQTPEWFRSRAVGRSGQGQSARRGVARGRRRQRTRAPRARGAARGAGTRGGAGAAVADARAGGAAHQPVRLRGAAPALAARRGTRRDDPHRRADRERVRRHQHHPRDGAPRRQHLAARRRQDLRARRPSGGAHPRPGPHRRRGGRHVPRRPARRRRAAAARHRHQRRAAGRAAAERRHRRRR